MELVSISKEMWGAFCDRIHVMYSRRQTLADAEQVKERLFVRKALQDNLTKEGQPNAHEFESEHKKSLLNGHSVPSSHQGSPLVPEAASEAAASRLKLSPDSQSQSPDIVKYMRRSPVSHHETDEEVYEEHIEAYKQLRQDSDEMVRLPVSRCLGVSACLSA